MTDLAQNTRLREHPLIHELLAIVNKYDLDLSDMVIFGSGPLLAKGLRENIHDLDIVARGKTWRRAKRHGDRSIGLVNRARIAQFREGRIQFSAGWVSDEWKAAELIDRAEIIEGLPFARIEDVLAYKHHLNRPKDQQDIERLRESGVVFTPAAVTGGRAIRGALRSRKNIHGRFLKIAGTRKGIFAYFAVLAESVVGPIKFLLTRSTTSAVSSWKSSISQCR